MNLTRRGWVALIGAILILAFGVGMATADVCYWGRCGPADNPPAIGTPYATVCPAAAGCNLGGTP